MIALAILGWVLATPTLLAFAFAAWLCIYEFMPSQRAIRRQAAELERRETAWREGRTNQ